ncbi:MAG: RlmE family RNA methyltransferase [Candidatus Hodarchaeaceae archaeon]|nr:RlmE family RNA methyltransferase [Candidatus Hodarchaeaceae archaeon]
MLGTAKQPRRERKLEHFYRKAKELKLRSRAAFKLKQLDNRYNMLRRGDVVVDLGAAPGGWLQVAREKVGREGAVLGVDLQPIAKLPHENVKTLVADITDPSVPDLIRQNLPRQADVVLSDASPKISGVWSVDHIRSIDLARAALAIAERVLTPGGKLLVKVFQGELFEKIVGEARERFELVKVSKPLASRKGSAEVYVIAKGFKTTQKSS